MGGRPGARSDLPAAWVDVKVGVNLFSPRPLIIFFFFPNTFLSAWVLVVEMNNF